MSAEAQADEFSRHNPHGTPVRFWPGARVGNGRLSTVCGSAWVMPSGLPVVRVRDYPGGIALTHIERVRSQRIYVASSWRNADQPAVVAALREQGFEVYDFRNPPGRPGFAWSEIDPDWQNWTAREYIAALDHPAAEAGYASDMGAMQWADTFVLVLPCGRSAHLELGWAVGAGKRTVLITKDGEEPELMAKMVDHIAVGLEDALNFLAGPR
jgi:nucleoside 2-deoxyribosyltransferase